MSSFTVTVLRRLIESKKVDSGDITITTINLLTLYKSSQYSD